LEYAGKGQRAYASMAEEINRSPFNRSHLRSQLIGGNPGIESLCNAAGCSGNGLEFAGRKNDCNKYDKKCDEKGCRTEGWEIHEDGEEDG
jgi:hypothetical protein